jgi:endonuclease-3
MPRESIKAKRQRAANIAAILDRVYPDAKCALDHTNPLELLVATILSAQCTDERVNVVTKRLFGKYRTASDYARLPQERFEQEIRSTGFYRNKARSIRAAAARIVEEFGGEVPDTMEGLVSLPGVARKTANVVLGSWFGRNEGIVVDTHVLRLARRLKLASAKVADKVEKELMDVVDRKDWTQFAHLLIFHGRAICSARKPKCGDCPIAELCPSAFKV